MSDPDGDELDFRWYVYREAGTYDGRVAMDNAQTSRVAVAIAGDAAGRQIHVILDVTDRNDIVKLFDYRRVVIDVRRDSSD